MRYFLTYTLLFCSVWMQAQPLNDDCTTAINIPSIDKYCSGELEFNNFNATPDPGLDQQGTGAGCFQQHLNSVWFTFIPREPAVALSIFSSTTTAEAGMSIYEGNCNTGLSLFDCSTGNTPDDELVITGMTIGQLYYLLIESDASDFSFTLCIDDFIAPLSPESDCPDAVVLCDKSDFSIEQLLGEGSITNELTGDCVGPGQEFESASAWYVWTCDQSGTLEFTITPGNTSSAVEDIDFIVYELPGGLNDCAGRISRRCMFSGQSGGPNDSNCLGPTGLRAGETDTDETAGCTTGDNNFVAPLDMVSGISYGLLINNFSQTGFGFSIDFGGTGTFLGPEPDFDLFTINAFECDKRIEITNSSQSLTDPIVSYVWNFGLGAEPQIAIGEGPHNISYVSFGSKSIALTVESERGCTVTKILDIDIEACCADTSTLDVAAIATDVICNGDADGTIMVDGISGAPQYNFSLNGGDFIPNTEFNNLEAGIYDITIIDIKGCETTTRVTVSEPPLIIPEAGPDITVDLGYSGQLMANYTPMEPGDIIEWTPAEGLSCTDCLNPEVIAPGTTTYTFTVTNDAGCSKQDVVIVTANIVRPAYFPNVITPTSGDANSIFTLGFGRQAELIEELIIYDRWGNPIYKCENIEPNNPNLGWDGSFGDCNSTTSDLVNPGVFVWMAKVRFIDQVVITYVNDVTVLK